VSVKNPYLEGDGYWPTRIAAIRFYKAGRSLRGAADLVGVSPSTVRRWLIAAGVERRGSGQRQRP
jgi:transposase-like protein